jgi:hypothetical protein
VAERMGLRKYYCIYQKMQMGLCIGVFLFLGSLMSCDCDEGPLQFLKKLRLNTKLFFLFLFEINIRSILINLLT